MRSPRKKLIYRSTSVVSQMYADDVVDTVDVNNLLDDDDDDGDDDDDVLLIG